MLSNTSKIILALIILVVITIGVYYIQIVRAGKYMPPTPIYIAKPDWYVTDREWHSNEVLYDGSNYYYSDNSIPKPN